MISKFILISLKFESYRLMNTILIYDKLMMSYNRIYNHLSNSNRTYVNEIVSDLVLVLKWIYQECYIHTSPIMYKVTYHTNFLKQSFTALVSISIINYYTLDVLNVYLIRQIYSSRLRIILLSRPHWFCGHPSNQKDKI